MGTDRQFHDLQAVRERVPFLLGLYGPSGSGKTYSALRVATGMRQVTGGEIFVIDTEHRRSLHYADDFDFRHVHFEAPFSSDSYRQAFEYCKRKGAGVVVVDSMSHEHEGPDGYLEFHDKLVEKMSGGDEAKAMRVGRGAWIKPKAARRRMIETIIQLGLDSIFCFRGKETMDDNFKKQGWSPVTGNDISYEMTLQSVLRPSGNGVPDWKPVGVNERLNIKLPNFAQRFFSDHTGSLDEETGEFLANWSMGGTASPTDPATWIESELGVGKRSSDTWRTFSEAAEGSAEHSYLVDAIGAVEGMENPPPEATEFKNRAIRVVAIIEGAT